jgi:hypothetical protein
VYRCLSEVNYVPNGFFKNPETAKFVPHENLIDISFGIVLYGIPIGFIYLIPFVRKYIDIHNAYFVIHLIGIILIWFHFLADPYFTQYLD